MLYVVAEVLHITAPVWRALPWFDQQAYIEGLQAREHIPPDFFDDDDLDEGSGTGEPSVDAWEAAGARVIRR